MASDPFADNLPRPRPAVHELGQDVSSLSQFELEERISALTEEIERLHKALEQRKRTHAAADSFFKRK